MNMINLGTLLVDKKLVGGFRISGANLYVILNNGLEYHLDLYSSHEEAVDARNKILMGLLDPEPPRTPSYLSVVA